MAREQRPQAILGLIQHIKGTVTDSELDTILSAAVTSYTQTPEVAEIDSEEWTLWFAEGLVELMISPHVKVAAYIQLGDLSRAYRLAKERGGYSDLMIVAEAAELDGDRSILRKCEKVLGRVRVDSRLETTPRR